MPDDLGVGSGWLLLTGELEPFQICVLDRTGIDAARLRDRGHPFGTQPGILWASRQSREHSCSAPETESTAA